MGTASDLMLWWGGIQAAVMTVVIIMNGLGLRSGWLAGAVAQLVMLVFGYGIFHSSTFLFMIIPMGGFIYNYIMQPRRQARKEAEYKKKLWEEVWSVGSDGSEPDTPGIVRHARHRLL